MSKKRRLFLSFFRTVGGLEANRILPDQLQDGLFILYCMREHTFDPNAVFKEVCDESAFPAIDAGFPDCPELREYLEKSRKAQKVLIDELRTAEKEGRVMYRLRRTKVSQWARLNRFLTTHGLPELQIPLREEFNYRDYVWFIPPKNRRNLESDRYWLPLAKPFRQGSVLLNPDGYTYELAVKLIKQQLNDWVEIVS